jgi:hypothetical protein
MCGVVGGDIERWDVLSETTSTPTSVGITIDRRRDTEGRQQNQFTHKLRSLMIGVLGQRCGKTSCYRVF